MSDSNRPYTRRDIPLLDSLHDACGIGFEWRGSAERRHILMRRDDVGNENSGYSLGKRTTEPHHPEGWNPKRENKEAGKVNTTKRGHVKSGLHDQSEKDD